MTLKKLKPTNLVQSLKSSILSTLLTLFIVTLITGCARPTVVYKEVKVPVRCDVVERKKPVKESNLVHYLREVLIYAEGLERDLQYCRTGSVKYLTETND